MPIYNFLNTETGEAFEDLISISRKEELLEKNPHIQQLPTAPNFITNAKTLDQRTDNGWKEVLSKVAEAHPDSVVGQRYGKKSIKRVRTEQIVDQHYKKWKNT
jgi:hypothetical protein